jgi:hypothetical protein
MERFRAFKQGAEMTARPVVARGSQLTTEGWTSVKESRLRRHASHIRKALIHVTRRRKNDTQG